MRWMRKDLSSSVGFFWLICIDTVWWPHLWGGNVILPETNYFIVQPLFTPKLRHPQRNGIKAIFAVTSTQSGRRLFSKHILMPSWQKVGIYCICLESVPSICLRCLHVPDYCLIACEMYWCVCMPLPSSMCEWESVWFSWGVLCLGTSGALSAGGCMLLWDCID